MRHVSFLENFTLNSTPIPLPPISLPEEPQTHRSMHAPHLPLAPVPSGFPPSGQLCPLGLSPSSPTSICKPCGLYLQTWKYPLWPCLAPTILLAIITITFFKFIYSHVHTLFGSFFPPALRPHISIT
jgi:hypothetical protein